MQDKKELNRTIAIVLVLIVILVLVWFTIKQKGDRSSIEEITPTTTMETNIQVAKAGDVVAMNYTGRLENGTVFDSNVDPKFNHVEPFVFTLGAGQVISGWDKGIVGMKVGEKKTLTIAPEDGYGAGGVPGLIPPNSTLIFDVELLGIVK